MCSRLRRLAAACRPFTPTVLLFILSVVPAAADVSGTVVDQSGRIVPRAYVRIVNSGVESAGQFADELGRFSLATATSAADCSVEARLTGFQPARP